MKLLFNLTWMTLKKLLLEEATIFLSEFSSRAFMHFNPSESVKCGAWTMAMMKIFLSLAKKCQKVTTWGTGEKSLSPSVASYENYTFFPHSFYAPHFMCAFRLIRVKQSNQRHPPVWRIFWQTCVERWKKLGQLPSLTWHSSKGFRLV